LCKHHDAITIEGDEEFDYDQELRSHDLIHLQTGSLEDDDSEESYRHAVMTSTLLTELEIIGKGVSYVFVHFFNNVHNI
jgi:hypothetical protein